MSHMMCLFHSSVSTQVVCHAMGFLHFFYPACVSHALSRQLCTIRLEPHIVSQYRIVGLRGKRYRKGGYPMPHGLYGREMDTSGINVTSNCSHAVNQLQDGNKQGFPTSTLAFIFITRSRLCYHCAKRQLTHKLGQFSWLCSYSSTLGFFFCGGRKAWQVEQAPYPIRLHSLQCELPAARAPKPSCFGT